MEEIDLELFQQNTHAREQARKTNASRYGDMLSTIVASARGMQLRKLILVVDDDPDIRIVVHDRLTMAGFQVVVAENAQCALELLAGMAADGLIVDFALPGMDGLELAKVVLGQQRPVPVMMITGQGLPDLMAKALMSGIREVMSKPLDLQKLTSAAKKWFGSPDCLLGR